MAEENKFSYDAWKEYLKTDKDMNNRRKFLTSLWESVCSALENALEKLPEADAMKRRRELTARNIFNVINTAKQKPNFRWQRKVIWNEEDERHEYVIQCLNPSSDWIFRKIKEERWVTNMHWTSINKYLQPVANKIWALKATLQVSSVPETSKQLGYKSMKTKTALVDGIDSNLSEIDEEVDIYEEERKKKERKKIEDAEINYGSKSPNTIDDEWNVVPNEDVINQEQFEGNDNLENEEEQKVVSWTVEYRNREIEPNEPKIIREEDWQLAFDFFGKSND